MAHTLDTKYRWPVTANTTVSGTTITFDYTCGVGATILVLCMIYANGTRSGAPTFNGVALTQADITRYAVTSPEARAELWYLLAPPTGAAHQFSIANANGLAMAFHVSSYKAQAGYTSALDVANGATGTSTNPTASVTTTVDGDALVSVVADGLNAWNPSSQDGTAIYNDDNGTWGGGSQYYLQATLGTKAMGWVANSDDWGLCVASFKEVPPTFKTSSDSGTGSESRPSTSPTVVRAITDAGTGGDVTSQRSAAQTDAGAASEARALTATDYSADTATGSEASVLLQAYAAQDAGAAAESKQLQAADASSDAGAGAEGHSLAVSQTRPDAGAAADFAMVAVSLSQLDGGNAAELSTITAQISTLDGGLADEISNLNTGGVSKQGSEGASASEGSDLRAEITALNIGLIAEVSDLIMTDPEYEDSDGGVASESSSLAVSLSGSDGGIAGEESSITVQIRALAVTVSRRVVNVEIAPSHLEVRIG